MEIAISNESSLIQTQLPLPTIETRQVIGTGSLERKL